MATPARTDQEILARINEPKGDFFGFANEALIDGLSFDAAQPYLTDDFKAKPDARQIWDVDTGDIAKIARNYLAFAVDKILGHRGISANRSVDKLNAYAWLLGRDDVVAAMEAADYPNYGAPKVKAFAAGMGWPEDFNPEDKELQRMAEGLPCEPGCAGGCRS